MNKIVIIGAGLAGLYAAKSAVDNGAEVEIIERKSRDKYNLKCGEMFTCLYGRPPAEAILREIDRWVFLLPDGSKMAIDLPEGHMVMTDRRKHERALVEYLKEKDVLIHYNVSRPDHISKLLEHEKPDIIIDATGAKSWDTRKNELAHAKCYILSGVKEYNNSTAYFVPNRLFTGYAWLFPRTDDTVNIGLGSERGISKYDGEHRGLDYLLDMFHIKDYRLEDAGAGRIPLNHNYTDEKNYYGLDYIGSRGGWVMYVGDAAGLVNPALEGGEHLAALSGILAGYTAATNSAFTAVREYYRLITSIIAPEMETGIYLSKMRRILRPSEFIGFIMLFKQLSINKDITDLVTENAVNYIRKRMKNVRVPVVKDSELEEYV